MATSALLQGPPRPSSIKELFTFPSHFIENVHFRPNGHLLLSTLSSNSLYTFDPLATPPKATPVVSCHGSTGLSGIATIGPDLFAVTGGVHRSFRFDDMKLYIISLPQDSQEGKLLDVIDVPGATCLNGMASLPTNPRIVLSADSHDSCIYRINTITRQVSVAVADPLLGHGTQAKLGINGIRISADGYAYFTNSGQGTFCRVQIDKQDGSKTGKVEVIAHIQGAEPSFHHAYDDFALDDSGNAYVTVHPNEVVRISNKGEQSTFAGGEDGGDVSFRDPTSAIMALDGKSVYIVTGGITIDETTGKRSSNGQLIKLVI